MKNQLKFLLFVAAILIVNIPLSTAKGPAESSAETSVTASGNIIDSLLFYGAGIDKMYAEDTGNTLTLEGLMGLEIPALDYISAAEFPKTDWAITQTDNPPPAENQEIPVAGDTAYNIEQLDYTEVFHTGQPLVLIYSTHTTESYQIQENPSSWRSKNKDISVIAVGHLIAKTLYEEHDIEVMHITDIFDEPYEGAYARSYDALVDAIENYPSIKYVLDVHRDGLSNTAAGRAAYFTRINDNPAAKVSTVLGIKSSYTPENKIFEKKIQTAMDSLYPGLYRRRIEKSYYYNQYVIPNSILLEVGSNLTTPEEARFTAILIGRTLGRVITEE